MKRSKFSLSNYRLLTGDMGQLLPMNVTEVLPGDTIQQATSLLVRVSPLLAPVMHPVRIRIHHWFVPHRLVWDDFEKFITGGTDGNDATVLPTIALGTGTGVAEKELGDYLGVPTGTDITVSALPFRAYDMIWNEFYRDKDLETALTVSTASGPDATTETDLQNVCWEKDFFTTSRPWTQLGDDVSMPLAGDAEVEWKTGEGPAILRNMSTGAAVPNETITFDASAQERSVGSGGVLTGIDPGGSLTADLSSATGPSINELRTALALQRYKEMRARYGNAYPEYLRCLGIKPSDGRLNRPEYLGGGVQTIQFSEVLQTGVTTSGTPDIGVAELKGHGVGAMRSNRYRKFFEEHGYIISVVSVLPKTMYADALPKHWDYATKEDFFQKELQHIGQQEIKNKEVRIGHATPEGVFGYQDRYDHLRRKESGISGEFRSTLNHWHLARQLTGNPACNAAFVSCEPSKRIHAVTNANTLWMMANHNMQARRIVSSNAQPRII